MYPICAERALQLTFDENYIQHHEIKREGLSKKLSKKKKTKSHRNSHQKRTQS